MIHDAVRTVPEGRARLLLLGELTRVLYHHREAEPITLDDAVQKYAPTTETLERQIVFSDDDDTGEEKLELERKRTKTKKKDKILGQGATGDPLLNLSMLSALEDVTKRASASTVAPARLSGVSSSHPDAFGEEGDEGGEEREHPSVLGLPLHTFGPSVTEASNESSRSGSSDGEDGDFTEMSSPFSWGRRDKTFEDFYEKAVAGDPSWMDPYLPENTQSMAGVAAEDLFTGDTNLLAQGWSPDNPTAFVRRRSSTSSVKDALAAAQEPVKMLDTAQANHFIDTLFSIVKPSAFVDATSTRCIHCNLLPTERPPATSELEEQGGVLYTGVLPHTAMKNGGLVRVPTNMFSTFDDDMWRTLSYELRADEIQRTKKGQKQDRTSAEKQRIIGILQRRMDRILETDSWKQITRLVDDAVNRAKTQHRTQALRIEKKTSAILLELKASRQENQSKEAQLVDLDMDRATIAELLAQENEVAQLEYGINSMNNKLFKLSAEAREVREQADDTTSKSHQIARTLEELRHTLQLLQQQVRYRNQKAVLEVLSTIKVNIDLKGLKEAMKPCEEELAIFQPYVPKFEEKDLQVLSDVASSLGNAEDFEDLTASLSSSMIARRSTSATSPSSPTAALVAAAGPIKRTSSLASMELVPTPKNQKTKSIVSTDSPKPADDSQAKPPDTSGDVADEADEAGEEPEPLFGFPCSACRMLEGFSPFCPATGLPHARCRFHDVVRSQRSQNLMVPDIGASLFPMLKDAHECANPDDQPPAEPTAPEAEQSPTSPSTRPVKQRAGKAKKGKGRLERKSSQGTKDSGSEDEASSDEDLKHVTRVKKKRKQPKHSADENTPPDSSLLPGGTLQKGHSFRPGTGIVEFQEACKEAQYFQSYLKSLMVFSGGAQTHEVTLLAMDAPYAQRSTELRTLLASADPASDAAVGVTGGSGHRKRKANLSAEDKEVDALNQKIAELKEVLRFAHIPVGDLLDMSSGFDRQVDGLTVKLKQQMALLAEEKRYLRELMPAPVVAEGSPRSETIAAKFLALAGGGMHIPPVTVERADGTASPKFGEQLTAEVGGGMGFSHVGSTDEDGSPSAAALAMETSSYMEATRQVIRSPSARSSPHLTVSSQQPQQEAEPSSILPPPPCSTTHLTPHPPTPTSAGPPPPLIRTTSTTGGISTLPVAGRSPKVTSMSPSAILTPQGANLTPQGASLTPQGSNLSPHPPSPFLQRTATPLRHRESLLPT